MCTRGSSHRQGTPDSVYTHLRDTASELFDLSVWLCASISILKCIVFYDYDFPFLNFLTLQLGNIDFKQCWAHGGLLLRTADSLQATVRRPRRSAAGPAWGPTTAGFACPEGLCRWDPTGRLLRNAAPPSPASAGYCHQAASGGDASSHLWVLPSIPDLGEKPHTVGPKNYVLSGHEWPEQSGTVQDFKLWGAQQELITGRSRVGKECSLSFCVLPMYFPWFLHTLFALRHSLWLRTGPPGDDGLCSLSRL